MFIPNHLHILIKGYMNIPPKKEEVLNAFLKSLVERVRMKVVAGPTSIYVDEPGNEGITGTVTLATSHGSIHVWDAKSPAMFQFDLYSCSDFKPEEILSELNKWFDIQDTYWVMIDRNQNQFFELDKGLFRPINTEGAGSEQSFEEKIFDSLREI